MRAAFVAFLILALVIPARAAPPSVHVLAAEMITTDDMTPARAFFVGVATHALLDATVQERVWDWTSAEANRGNLGAVFSEAVLLCLAYSRPMTRAQRWAVVGALLPDVIDGLWSLSNPAAWEAGLLIIPWHIFW
ncbi:MAG: hypothetical protein QME79_12345 [Bacillota bacterium]|nr:hypothetical protein [Bacillota bacterium]